MHRKDSCGIHLHGLEFHNGLEILTPNRVDSRFEGEKLPYMASSLKYKSHFSMLQQFPFST